MSLIPNIPKEIAKLIEQLTNGFTEPLKEGAKIIRDAENNVYSIVKRAEDGLVTIIKNGEVIVQDIERNIFRTMRYVVREVAQTVQTGEREIGGAVRRGEAEIGATTRQYVTDAAFTAEDIERNITNDYRATVRTVGAVADNQWDQINHTVFTIQNNIFSTIHLAMLLGGTLAIGITIRYGDEIIETFDIIGPELLAITGNTLAKMTDSIAEAATPF